VAYGILVHDESQIILRCSVAVATRRWRVRHIAPQCLPGLAPCCPVNRTRGSLISPTGASLIHRLGSCSIYAAKPFIQLDGAY